MEDQTNEPQDVETTEVEETDVEETPEPTDDINELKAQLKKYEERGITQRERTRALKAEIEKLKKAIAPKEAPSKQTGELDETQLDYLDLKGISEAEDIAVIESIVKRTGVTVRQALKDEYVLAKLEANKANREVKAATPSSTKRGGSQSNDLQAAIAKYEQSGYTELPSDYTLRSQVINAMVDKQNGNKPTWR